MTSLIKLFKNFLSHQCKKCKVGKVSHSHSEPIGKWNTWIEVYQCNHCKEKFV